MYKKAAELKGSKGKKLWAWNSLILCVMSLTDKIDTNEVSFSIAINSFPKNEEFNAEEELNNCLAQITKNFYNERINSLIKKQADNQLTSDEKVELKEIIHKNKIKR